MRFCFLLERGNPPRINPVLAEAIQLLEARSHRVQALYAEEELLRLDTLTVDADLYLLKSDTELSLSLASALEGLGALVLNRASACRVAKDKLQTAALIRRARIPAPRSLAAALPAQLAPSLSAGPLILKPPRGYHGVGLSVVETPAALPGAGAYPDLVFAQEYLARARLDLKVFGIGDRVFGVRKAFSKDSFWHAGEATPLSPGVEAIARRCAQAFGLELYGLDLAEDENGVHLLDVNYFPGYRGVPEAGRLLAQHIEAAAVSTPSCRANAEAWG